jgi:predicted metal-binding membrane protein
MSYHGPYTHRVTSRRRTLRSNRAAGAWSRGRFRAVILAVVVVAVAAAIAYDVSSSVRTGTPSNSNSAAHSAMDAENPALLAPNH